MNFEQYMEVFKEALDSKYNQTKGSIDVQYAVVYGVANGRPVIRFAGEPNNSPKSYSCFKSYVPEVGDRVILINDIIIGGWTVQNN